MFKVRGQNVLEFLTNDSLNPQVKSTGTKIIILVRIAWVQMLFGVKEGVFDHELATGKRQRNCNFKVS